jgi:hypothetical protein
MGKPKELTREQQREQIRSELIKEIKNPSSWYRKYKSKGGLSKKAKFLKNPDNLKERK